MGKQRKRIFTGTDQRVNLCEMMKSGKQTPKMLYYVSLIERSNSVFFLSAKNSMCWKFSLRKHQKRDKKKTLKSDANTKLCQVWKKGNSSRKEKLDSWNSKHIASAVDPLFKTNPTNLIISVPLGKDWLIFSFSILPYLVIKWMPPVHLTFRKIVRINFFYLEKNLNHATKLFAQSWTQPYLVFIFASFFFSIVVLWRTFFDKIEFGPEKVLTHLYTYSLTVPHWSDTLCKKREERKRREYIWTLPWARVFSIQKDGYNRDT